MEYLSIAGMLGLGLGLGILPIVVSLSVELWLRSRPGDRPLGNSSEKSGGHSLTHSRSR
ncbi:MAG: hypothetical protein H6Q86_6039 [candidate division NC10 bacterium]|jgi:hypothetical protein|nr:hypothetical protein [candidate division NC10 bacterium]